MVPPSLSEKNFPPLPCQQAVNVAQQPFLQPLLQQPGIMSHSNSFPGMSNYSPGNYSAPNEHTFSNANEPTAISSKPPIDTMSYEPFLQKPLNFPELPSFVNVNSNTPSRHEKQRPQLHGTNDQIQKTSKADFLEMKDTIFQLQKQIQNVLSYLPKINPMQSLI